MRAHRAWILLVALAAAGCSFSTANIADATMAKDADGKQPTTVFAPTDTLYCVVRLENAPEGTKVKSVWTCVSAPGVSNHEIESAELVPDSIDATMNFKLENDQPWPAGKYKVDLYLDGERDRTIEFSVAAAGGS